MQKFVFVMTVAAALLVGVAVADAGQRHVSNDVLVAPYATVYASPAELAPNLPVSTSRFNEASSRETMRERALQPSGGSDGGKKYLPVLYSLIVPGAGEIALGRYWRGALLVAVEAAAWTGYSIYNNRGLDGRGEFEAFADAHWDNDRWITNHLALDGLGSEFQNFADLDSIGRSPGYSGLWPGWHSYAAKSDEKLNYYENIGKYDWFISGWEDWAGGASAQDTDLRTEYRGLRGKSNDDLDTADRFIYLSIAARVFSLVETVLLVRGQSDDQATNESNSGKNYGFKARAKGVRSGEFAFEYSF